MTECILITQESYPYFEALLSSEAKRILATDESTFAIGAIAYNHAVGVALVSVQKTSVHILYMYVVEVYRRMGIARDMLKFMCEYAYEGELVIRCVFAAKDIHDPMYGLFRDSGVFAIEQNYGYVCSSKIADLGNIDKMVSPNSLKGFKVAGLYDLPRKTLYSWYEHLQDTGKMLIDSSSEGYDEEMSICTTDKDGNITSALLVEDKCISFLWCEKGYEVNIAKLLYLEYQLMKKRYKDDEMIQVVAINESSVGLVERLMPNKEITSHIYEAVWNLEL